MRQAEVGFAAKIKPSPRVAIRFGDNASRDLPSSCLAAYLCPYGKSCFSPPRQGHHFGLGPGPDTRDRDAAARAAVLSPLAREEDEAAASLLGIIWEAQLGQPALASFLDQNWLEGLERCAHSHFAGVLNKLQCRGLLHLRLPGLFDRAVTFRKGRGAAAKTAEPGCTPVPFAEAPGECAELHRPATPASMRRSLGWVDTLSLRGSSPDLPSEPPGRSPVQHRIGTRVPGAGEKARRR